MSEIQKYDQLIQSILDELDVDVVGLWTIPEDLRGLYRLADPKEIRQVTLKIAGQLLSHSGVIFGQFEVGFFQPWQQPITEIVELIDAKWKHLGREPKFLEIGWFAKEDTTSYQLE
jgi:hypothetical protein